MTEIKEVITLADTVHRCLMCNELAYEYKEDAFRCSDKECDFIWTVTHCG